ncbi:MAP/microtubule affinity-regulating kinase 3-like [Otolemur garnettii]|uniref:MAP/microtubule affinity-regulating kinase 3-like n=1 Tax=Otolemur garnettii TaxID=30611 RepID=UPI000C7ED392|nr:MAP/microtubule affinity-regulating kinase 3-like [Otolemur garnettii]
MGYSQEEIEESLSKMKHDEIIPYSCCLRENFQSWTLVIPVLAAVFHLLGSGQAVVSATTLASLKPEAETLPSGPAIPSVVAYPKRSQTNTKDSDHKEDGIPSQISRGIAVGREGIAPANPMLGDARKAPLVTIPDQ